MGRVGVVGATGYTGMDLLRILLGHGGVELTYATSRTWAGKRLGEALPHLGLHKGGDLLLEDFDSDAAAGRADLVFLCLPHGQSAEAAAELRGRGVRVVDLSADFRLGDLVEHERWYGPHPRPGLMAEAVNGFPEIYREAIAGAGLVANPGCYPTSVVLALLPLVEEGLVALDTVVADSKSGVSGAGREPKPHLHFPEVEGNFSAYSVAGRHRHTAEIEQELARLAGGPVRVTFTPHLLPVSRGILSTVYASLVREVTEAEVSERFARRYAGEPFVGLRGPADPLPDIKSVRGTNVCLVAPRVDPRTGRLVVISCIDNLVKGAAGQAVQNMNIMLGLPETAGLGSTALVP